MAITKMAKKDIDTKVLRFLAIDEAIKKLKKEATALKNELEGQYIEEPKVKEIISGMTTEFEKIPVNNGAHSYIIEKIKPFTDAIGKTDEVITTVTMEVLDAKKFEALCPAFLPKTVLDTCRLDDNWTFKSKFRRKEQVTQGTEIITKPKRTRAKKVVGQ